MSKKPSCISFKPRQMCSVFWWDSTWSFNGAQSWGTDTFAVLGSGLRFRTKNLAVLCSGLRFRTKNLAVLGSGLRFRTKNRAVLGSGLRSWTVNHAVLGSGLRSWTVKRAVLGSGLRFRTAKMQFRFFCIFCIKNRLNLSKNRCFYTKPYL